MSRHIILLCVMLLASITTAHAVKPSSPLAVEIVPLGSIKPGQETHFKVTVVSQIPVEELLINIHPIGGVKWSQGEQHWRGQASAGVPVIKEFSVIPPKSGNFEIHAVASVQGKGGGGFGARAIYIYEDPATKKPVPKEHKAIRHGKEIIEVPVK